MVRALPPCFASCCCTHSISSASSRLHLSLRRFNWFDPYVIREANVNRDSRLYWDSAWTRHLTTCPSSWPADPVSLQPTRLTPELGAQFGATLLAPRPWFVAVHRGFPDDPGQPVIVLEPRCAVYSGIRAPPSPALPYACSTAVHEVLEFKGRKYRSKP